MASIWDPLSSLAPVEAVAGMRAAVLVPIYEDDGHLRLIMTRRPDDMRRHPGDVVFPGGMIEDDDGGPVETALRETEEEIGLPRENVEVLGALDVVHTRSATMRIVPVVARVRRPETLHPEPSEVAAIIEPRISDLLRDDEWRTSRWFGRTMWFYEFPEGTLWGATASMVRILLEHFRHAGPSA